MAERSIKQKIKQGAIDLAKDLTGVTNFENAADAFKRAQATQNAVDGNIGKGLSSLPSYAKDIGVGIGQAALGVGTAAINFLPAGKARKAADKVSGLITGGGKKVVTKTEVLSTEVNEKVTSTNKNVADAKAAAANAAKELAAAKKAAADAKIKADNAKTAEDAKKANEAKRKAEQEVKDALAAKKAAAAKAAEAKVIADKAAADKVLVDKALANEKAAVEKAAALKAKQDADAKAAADLKAKKEADAKAAADAKAKAAADLKAKQDANTKAREDAAKKREEDAKKREDDAATAKAKREEDALKAKKDRDAKQDARLKELEKTRLKREEDARIAKQKGEEDAKKREDDAKKKREDDAKKREEYAAATKKLRDDAKAKREEEIRLRKESRTGGTSGKGGFVPDGDGGLDDDDNDDDTDVVINPFGSSKDDKDATDAVDNGDDDGDDNGDKGGSTSFVPDGDGGVTETEVFPEEDPAAAAAAAAAAAKKAEEDRLAAEKRTSNLQLLKSLLRGMGFSSAFIDKSTAFLMDLLSDDIEPDNAVSIFLDSKDYTFKNGGTKNSPFYDDYGYLNDGLTQPKSAKDIYHFVEGTRNLVKSYNVSSKFAEPDALKKYVANNVTVEKLDERMMSAKLKTITADPQYVNTLRELKYINKSEDLTDFFLDPTIGEAQLEINRKTASFATEAMRRSNLTTGISFNPNSLTATAASLIGQGRSEAEIGIIANQGYETISEVLQPEVGLSNIFEGTGAANAQTIQSELEAEQFLNMGSARRKKLKELGTNVFKESSGRNTGRTTTNSNYSSAGQI